MPEASTNNQSDVNRWKERQYPINNSEHADRFVKWCNDCFAMFNRDGFRPEVSLYRFLS